MAYIEQNGKLVWQDTPAQPATMPATGIQAAQVAPTTQAPAPQTTTKLNPTTGLLEKVAVAVPTAMTNEKMAAAPVSISKEPPVSTAAPLVDGTKKYLDEYRALQASVVNPYEQKMKDLTTQYETALGTQTSQADALQTAYQQAGIPEQQKKLQQLNEQIAQMTASYDKGLVDIEGKAIPMQFITGQQALMQRQKAAEVGALTSIQQAVAGNIDLARQTAKETVALKYEDEQNKINALKNQLELNYDRFNEAEKKRADEMNFVLERQQQALDEQKKKESDINSLMLKAAEVGADQATINAIKNAKTLGDAIALSSKFFSPTSTGAGNWSTFEDADGNTFLYDKDTGSVKPGVVGAEDSQASFTDANGTTWNIDGWATDPTKAKQMQIIADKVGKLDDSNLEAKVAQLAPGLTADMIRNTSAKTGVSWEALLTMAIQESGGGTSNVAKGNNNFAGLTWNNQEWVKAYGGTKGTARPSAEGGNYIKFPTKQAGLDAMGALMAKYGTVGTAGETKNELALQAFGSGKLTETQQIALDIFNGTGSLSNVSTKNDKQSKVASELAKLRNTAKSTNELTGLMQSSAGGKDVSDAFIQSFEKALNVVGQIDDLNNIFSSGVAPKKDQTNGVDLNPLLGQIRKFNPWDKDAQSIQATLQAIVPNLARGIYGEVGVLTDADIKNYSKTLPTLTSTAEVQQAVLGITLRSIQRSIENKLKTQANAGRDVSGYITQYNDIKAQADNILNNLGKTAQTTTNTEADDYASQYMKNLNATLPPANVEEKKKNWFTRSVDYIASLFK